eukprot:777217-Pyramimonas_sp.AAC.1
MNGGAACSAWGQAPAPRAPLGHSHLESGLPREVLGLTHVMRRTLWDRPCPPTVETQTCQDRSYAATDDGRVQLYQDERIKQLHPVRHPELAGAVAEDKATKTVSDRFINLRGALACALVAQAWSMAFVVPCNLLRGPPTYEREDSTPRAQTAARPTANNR